MKYTEQASSSLNIITLYPSLDVQVGVDGIGIVDIRRAGLLLLGLSLRLSLRLRKDGGLNLSLGLGLRLNRCRLYLDR